MSLLTLNGSLLHDSVWSPPLPTEGRKEGREEDERTFSNTESTQRFKGLCFKHNYSLSIFSCRRAGAPSFRSFHVAQPQTFKRYRVY